MSLTLARPGRAAISAFLTCRSGPGRTPEKIGNMVRLILAMSLASCQFPLDEAPPPGFWQDGGEASSPDEIAAGGDRDTDLLFPDQSIKSDGPSDTDLSPEGPTCPTPSSDPAKPICDEVTGAGCTTSGETCVLSTTCRWTCSLCSPDGCLPGHTKIGNTCRRLCRADAHCSALGQKCLGLLPCPDGKEGGGYYCQ